MTEAITRRSSFLQWIAEHPGVTSLNVVLGVLGTGATLLGGQDANATTLDVLEKGHTRTEMAPSNDANVNGRSFVDVVTDARSATDLFLRCQVQAADGLVPIALDDIRTLAKAASDGLLSRDAVVKKVGAWVASGMASDESLDFLRDLAASILPSAPKEVANDVDVKALVHELTIHREVSVALLTKLAPQMKKDDAQLYAWKINEAMQEFGVDTPLRRAHFLAQIIHESDHLKTLVEYESGAKYEGRRDLGNTVRGDGRLFRGRGAIQLTGRANYTEASKYFGIDLVKHPTLAADPVLAFRIAGWFWQSKNLNTIADKDDVTRVTKRVNGGRNGLQDRMNILHKAKVQLAVR